MNNIFKIACILITLILIVITLVIALPSQAYAQSLLVNPSFEDPLGSVWTTTGLAFRVATGLIQDGSYAAQIMGTSGSFTQWIPNATSLARYVFWGWVYVTGNATGFLEIDFFNISGSNQTQLIPTTILSATNTGGIYIQKSTDIRAPLDTTDIRIRLRGAAGIWGEVRFDNLGLSLPSGGCFIATAASSSNDANVDTLRIFRDKTLLKDSTGTLLVNRYYITSPPLASFIAEHPSAKPITRVGLLPVVIVSKVSLTVSPIQIIILLSIILIITGFTFYILRRHLSTK